MARERNDLLSLVKAQVNISDALFEMGEYAESAQVAEAGAALALKIGVSRSTGAYLRSNLAEALVALGRWDDADAVCVAAARFDPPGELGLHWLEIRAALRLARGHASAPELIGRALAFLRRPYVSAQHRLPLLVLQMEAALSAGDPTAAAASAHSGLAATDLVDNARYTWALLAVSAHAAVAADDPVLRTSIEALAGQLECLFPADRAYAAEIVATFAAAAPGSAVAVWRGNVAGAGLRSSRSGPGESMAPTPWGSSVWPGVPCLGGVVRLGPQVPPLRQGRAPLRTPPPR